MGGSPKAWVQSRSREAQCGVCPQVAEAARKCLGFGCTCACVLDTCVCPHPLPACPTAEPATAESNLQISARQEIPFFFFFFARFFILKRSQGSKSSCFQGRKSGLTSLRQGKNAGKMDLSSNLEQWDAGRRKPRKERGSWCFCPRWDRAAACGPSGADGAQQAGVAAASLPRDSGSLRSSLPTIAGFRHGPARFPVFPWPIAEHGSAACMRPVPSSTKPCPRPPMHQNLGFLHCSIYTCVSVHVHVLVCT